MYAIGVDIGGTKIAAGLVDEDGKILKSARRSTQANNPESIEMTVVDLVNELSQDVQVGGVGVVSPGFCSNDRATVNFAGNLAFINHPLRDRLAQYIDVPIVVENDANAAGWAEFRFGAGKGTTDMLMLTVGTGLGGAIVMNSELQRGHFGGAGEVAHMRVVPHGHRCTCGHDGCWEQYASGSSLLKHTRQAMISDADRCSTLLQLCGGNPDNLTGPMIDDAAFDGDMVAIEQLAYLGSWLGQGIAAMAAILDPQRVVIGGGVCHAGDLLLLPSRKAYLHGLFARGHRPELDIVLAAFGNEAGIVGAADLTRF